MSFRFLLFFIILSIDTAAQQASNDSGQFLIHKFEKTIGKESYSTTSINNSRQYTINFSFTDRGTAVNLQANYTDNIKQKPVSFWIKGATSRFSSIDDSVAINGQQAYVNVNGKASLKKNSIATFPIGGYAPATMQCLLVSFWKKYGRPQTIKTLPAGAVRIKADGYDTIPFLGKPLLLQRYVIDDIIWGHELLWMDKDNHLICLITNDAEGDKIEVVSAEHEALLTNFADRSAVIGMRLFTASEKKHFPVYPLIAITGVYIPNLQTGDAISDATVIIKEGKIKSIGSQNAKIPAGAHVINAAGKTLLPGLWDMHAHFSQAEWGPAYLAAGVTTVRDCGNEFGYINAVKEAIDNNKGVGPHILKAGIIDGNGPNAIGVIQAGKKEEAIPIVRRYKDAGFVQIKIYSSVKPEVVKAICDEAHRLGMTVTGHVPRGMTAFQAIDSGMDMINHAPYITRLMKTDSGVVNLTDPQSLEVFRFLKAHHTVIDPTLGVFELSDRALTDDIRLIEPAFATLPLPLQTLFLNTGNSEPDKITFARAFLKANMTVVNQLVKDNIPVVAGTDMDIPGYSLFRELELYVQSGLTPLQAIRTATITPASVMKLNNQYGEIAAGKAGDVIIVDGNPLEDIHLIRKIQWVIKNGTLYDPAVLRKMAGFTR